METNNKDLVVRMENITKKFGDFIANDGIDLDIRRGEIHSLLGENGAGKTTLMNMLYGLSSPTSGEIYINNEKKEFKDPNDAIKAGLGMVHQHFMLIEPFTVVENIVLGMEPMNGIKVDIKKAREDVVALSEKYGFKIDPDARIQDITVGTQQKVEILKVLYRGADILIFDEPTAVLTPQEITELIEIIKNLAKEGKSIIIITHKLKEIKQVANRCTIIRRGKKIDTVNVSDVGESELADMMVGRAVHLDVNKADANFGDTILDIKGLTARDIRNVKKLDDLNLDIKAGEIHGIAGVDGNGQSELIETLTGLKKAEAGSVIFKGEEILNHSPRDIIERGLNSIPEDRQLRGLVLDFSVAENIILKEYYKDRFSKKGILDFPNIEKNASDLSEDYDIRPRNIKQFAGALSGGNQQKVIIAREISGDPDLLIAAQPTRGLDVGAIEYIRNFLIKQRDKGKAVLLISFELDEIMALSDRISVIYNGKILRTFDAKETNERELGLYMAGGKNEEK